MNETQAIVEEKGPGKSPYLAARDEWNERYRDLIVAARNWRLLAVTTSAVALVAVLGLIVIGTKPKVIPYIVAVDNLGKVVSQGTAVQASVADDRLKRAALWSWVQDWRMVSSDATVEKNADRTGVCGDRQRNSRCDQDQRWVSRWVAVEAGADGDGFRQCPRSLCVLEGQL